MVNKKDYTLGIILILLGVAFLLSNANIVSRDIFLVVIGIGFLIGYYYKKSTGYLIVGLILLVVGGTSIIEELTIINIDISGFVFMWGLGIVFLSLYFVKKMHGFIYPGCILPAIGTHTLIEELFILDMGWSFFLLLGLSFYAIYIIDGIQWGRKWPLIPGTILVGLSGLFFLTSREILSLEFWKIVSYTWPALLILIGIRIVYNNTRKN